MKRFAYLVVLCLAIGLRFWQLGAVPHGLTWDEAAIGYNGYAVFTTRRDEWLVRLPISFRSFGDYKAPLAIYLSGVSSAVFGLTPWAVRFPFAVAGVLAVVGMMVLTDRVLVLCDAKREETTWFPLLSGVLLTLSPWHVHFSRVGFESGMMLAFLLWGSVGLVELCLASGWKRRLFAALLAVCGCSASIYTYHSAKIMLPMFLLFFAAWQWSKLWERRWWVLASTVSGGLVLWPFITDTLWGAGGERFTQASVFGLPLSVWQQMSAVGSHFWAHFSLDYLVFGATPTLRHGMGAWGVLLSPMLLAVALGGIFYLREVVLGKWATRHNQFFLWAVSWIVIGTLPAAIGRDVPHANRQLAALPGFIWLASYGLSMLHAWVSAHPLSTQLSGTKSEQQIVSKSILGTWVLLVFLTAVASIQYYFTVFARQTSDAFQDGAIEAAAFAAKYEKQSDKILFTSTYGQPYIYALFARKTNPIWYQGGSLIKYEFTDNIHPGDLLRTKTTIVATPKEVGGLTGATGVILGSDGQPRFVLFAPKDQP